MTHLFNDPKHFAGEALAGFAAANPRYVQGVHGGVVRAGESPRGQVALVIGGGSGHYPAFAGWVGTGMAHGAACGNVFASPSASQVESVARAADNGGGILLLFGNYAGDVLNFTQAANRLRGNGIDVRIVTVSDDVASDGPERAPDRRGVAGDLVVVKIAGAAAESGWPLDRVEAIARRANERTRTIGVAFGGCTLPGAGHPQFTVTAGTMAIGLGIHGEPGLSAQPLALADQVADLLVQRVLAEEPPRGPGGYQGRVTVVLNGLGATKYEELFVVYRRVAETLAGRGLAAVEPEVGEHVTSLDMAGLSLTVTFLDPELERLWCAPVDAPALRKGSLAFTGQPALRRTEAAAPAEPGADGVPAPGSIPSPRSDPSPTPTVATDASRRVAGRICRALEAMAGAARDAEERLAALDSIAGDGDHGQGIAVGTAAAVAAAQGAVARGAGARATLTAAGDAWAESAGGTSGALWGAALRAAASQLSDTAGVTALTIADAAEHAAAAIGEMGGATVGDKTMVDAVAPFVSALRSGVTGDLADADTTPDLALAWRSAVDAAQAAAARTADLVAARGRARIHGAASVGHPDPGAVSFALLMQAAGDALADGPGADRNGADAHAPDPHGPDPNSKGDKDS